jgi:hypothetical protein
MFALKMFQPKLGEERKRCHTITTNFPNHGICATSQKQQFFSFAISLKNHILSLVRGILPFTKIYHKHILGSNPTVLP